MTGRTQRLLDYAAVAQQHRPTCHTVLQAEVRRLATAQGLTACDIATALRIDLLQVRQMLAMTGQEAAEAHRSAWR